ncbi:LysR family transcriptional regulator [Cupriavidus sp. TA19]|uniref:LysR substrate-binding domain-containing protein n=1 Tax=unclassified Cupriavidus TaxID=2640874 RepID=UPI000EE7A47F|nr:MULTISPECIES: LysR substrate-binding domain-containing protein [unclassified Cupriavidus]BDB24232.1 LysR family transcriptional regulator [Cupriavidus sp. P-10]GLC91028.1 LysR family transcriptional regulator [Cupriavidus sp. TA19]
MQYRLPPLNTLRIFEAIYRRGSIRQAAAELCLTPQAISQQLKILESSLGQSLFERSIRSLTPTEAARRLYGPVKEGLDQFAQGVSAVSGDTAKKSLYLHVSPYFSTHYLVRNLGNFTADLPELEFRMSVGVEMVDLDHQGIDAAIHWGYGGSSTLTEIPLIEDLKVLVAAPPLLARQPINAPEDLLRHNLVLPLAKNSLWPDTLEMLGLEPKAGQSVLQLHTHDAMLEATLAGLGIGFISYLDALRHIEAGELVAPFGVDLLRQLPLEKTPQFFLCFKQERAQSPVLKRFIEWLLEYVCQPEVIGYESRCKWKAG